MERQGLPLCLPNRRGHQGQALETLLVKRHYNNPYLAAERRATTCRADRMAKCPCAGCTKFRDIGRQVGEYWRTKEIACLTGIFKQAEAERTQMSNPEYDYTKCKRETLEHLAAIVQNTWFPSGSIQANVLKAVREEALVKTLAEYDAEIGELLRKHLEEYGGIEPQHWKKLRELALESKLVKDTLAARLV